VGDIKVFKIKHAQTGLFSTGGMEPRWTTKGKTWSTIGSVKNHLRQFTDGGIMRRNYDGTTEVDGFRNHIPDDWVVVEYVLREDQVNAVSAKTLIKGPAGAI
jgi:hypothetical protein